MTDQDGSIQWYFAEGGATTGPLPEAEFETAVANGRIGPDTLVWREGLDGWKPLRELRPEAVTGESAAPESCSQCGQTFAAADLIRLGDARVCAACKPAFLQRLQENASMPNARHYAGFWIRFAAVFIDGIVMNIVQYAIYIPVILVISRSMDAGNSWAMIAAQILLSLFSMALAAGYEIWMVGRYGATLGKLACRLRVITADGDRVSYARATGRHFAKYIGYLTMYIGFIIAGFDREKRALHDIICNTRVVRI